METEKIRKLLDVADRIEKEPGYIFETDCPGLFLSDRMLREITTGGKELPEYAADELMQKPPFAGTDIAVWGHEFRVSICGIDKNGRSESREDLITIVDIAEKTYRMCDVTETYKCEKPEFVTAEPDEFWQRLENLTVKKRFANIRGEIRNNLKFRTKLVNCFFWLIISRKKADKVSAREIGRVQAKNERNRKYFESELETYEGIQKHLPEYLAETEEKKKEIAGYLEKYGYRGI